MATVDLVVREGGRQESWIERGVPWVSSFLVHAGLGLVGVFVLFVAVGRGVEAGGVIDIPTALEGPDDPLKQGKIAERDSAVTDPREAMQNLLKKNSDGVDAFGQVALSSLTRGGISENSGIPAEIIAGGIGGTLGRGDGNLLGTPGKMAGYGPILVTGGSGPILYKFHGKKVVYLLDHSGSMLDSFDFLREEVIERTRELKAGQQFAVIMFSEQVTVLGPERLQRATSEVTGEVAKKLGGMRAGGHNDGELKVFQEGFERAFAMKPEAIIFLTDGNFDPALVKVVSKLNLGGKVQVQTIAFVSIGADAEGALKAIARENGGEYKFVSSKELGK